MISQKIKELRKGMGLTQAELSQLLNVKFSLKTDRATVSNWERGASTPVFSTLSCLAELFNVSLDYLTGNEAKNDDEIIKAALFGGSENVTSEMLEEVRNFAKFVAAREAKNNENN
jgi:transcriptional regulator with XRE-family HTH domain